MCKRDEVLPWTGLDEEPVGPFPAEPPFGSPEAVEQATETIRATAKAQTPGEAIARVASDDSWSRRDWSRSRRTLASAPPTTSSTTPPTTSSTTSISASSACCSVARLGGEVEGRPTHRGNFLQRIDELRRQEGELLAAEAERLRAELMQSRADHAETVEKWRAVVQDDFRHRELLTAATQQRDALAEALIQAKTAIATLSDGASHSPWLGKTVSQIEAALKGVGRLP